MPQRVNSLSDIGTAKVSSDSYDVDNIFLTDQGWVYRHYKKEDKSEFWDEIIVAGQVPAEDETGALVTGDDPVTLTTYSTTGGGSEEWAPGLDFETGDSKPDIEYRKGGAGVPAVGSARYTTYEQYPPFATGDSGTDGDGTGGGGGDGGAGGDGDSSSDSSSSGSDNSTPAPTPTDVSITFTDVASGNSGYISAGGTNAGVSIQAGATLTINNNSGGHPVNVVTVSGDETSTVTSGTLSGAPAGNGASVTWDTTGVTPGTYYYICTAHPAVMEGTITVTA